MLLPREGYHAYILLFVFVSSVPALLGRTLMTRNDTAHSLPLTFGIEIEYLLAFQESHLRPFLPSSRHIVKSIPDDHRVALRQVTQQYFLTRPQYNGWALMTPTAYPSPFGRDWHNECLLKYGYRAYADEILRMQSKLLAYRGLDARIHDGKKKMDVFDKWHLTTDTSLMGATRDDLATVLKTNQIAGNVDEWDSGPVELVSRILRVDEEASFAEIGLYLAALQPMPTHRHRRKTYTAFTDDFCGLHVHIGLPPPPSSAPSSLSPSSSSASPTLIFPSYPSSSSSSSSFHPHKEDPHTFSLPLLQHLAYITLIYEPILSRLHPPRRRPGVKITEMDIDSNRGLFYEGLDFREAASSNEELDLGCTRRPAEAEEKDKQPWIEEEDDTNDEDLLRDLRFQQHARTLIFDEAMTLEHLCGLMSEGRKGRIINWTYLSRAPGIVKDGPRTIEFRQHEGTLDREEIRMWVLFCAELLRWAKVIAEKYQAEVQELHEVTEKSGMKVVQGGFIQRLSGGQLPIRGPPPRPRWGRRNSAPDEGRKRKQGMEKWLQEAYGREVLGIEDLIEHMGLKGELREWVIKRRVMWKDE